jgi:platelet-activating factor acetylhydrolase IB subunit beta/gamma
MLAAQRRDRCPLISFRFSNFQHTKTAVGDVYSMSNSNQSPHHSSQPKNMVNHYPDALTPTERTDEHFIERHATFLKQAKETTIRLLFLGDSITRRWVDVLNLWEHYFAHYQPANFGVGGDVVESLLWRVQNGEIDNIQPRVVVLLIGTNNVPTNSGSEIADSIRQIVATIQMKLPQTKILLMAIFPRGPQVQSNSDATNPYFMDVVHTANKLLSSLDNQDSIRFLDIGPLFFGADGEIDTSLMPDRLHLIEPGYKIWAESMKDILKDMMS